MECPNCKVTLAMTDRQGVEIDYCPQCRGVWLDRGELDKIIERASQEPVPAQPAVRDSYRPGRHESDAHYGKHRKKSLLKDLFDF